MKYFRRMAGAVAAGVLVVVLLALALPGRALVHGVDVSQWQYDIDWPTFVSENQIDFAYIKYTDSHSLIDPKAVQNVAGAQANGVPFGVYHFATPFSELRNRQHFDYDDAVWEATWFAEQAGQYMGYGHLPPVVDMEFGHMAGRELLTDWCRTFLDTVESLTGVRPIIYANQNWANNYLTASELDTQLWIARWTDNPHIGPSSLGGWSDYLFHQYTSTLTLPGVVGNTVDGDVFNGSASDLQRLLYPRVIPEPAGLAMGAAIPLLFRSRRAA